MRKPTHTKTHNNEFDENHIKKDLAAMLSNEELIQAFLGKHKDDNAEILLRDL